LNFLLLIYFKSCYEFKMPRKARIDAPLALHHIIARGIERRNIFRDNVDRNDFLDRLSDILSDTQTPCYAWALMPNHFHLLLRTAGAPLSLLMKRLLTGYVVTFNRRHKRSGRLFQNRFKSILCQEETYLLELIRYIHLNPIRANNVANLQALGRYKYCGHGALMGKFQTSWQDTDAVLVHFGKQYDEARQNYYRFVAKGIDRGKRPELTGGGIIRSMGGWTKYLSEKKMQKHLKGDERILGDSDFVQSVLQNQNEDLERKYRLQVAGINFKAVVEEVADMYQLEPESLLVPGGRGLLAMGRALICFWCVTELGMRGIQVAEKMKISPGAVTKSAKRGREMAKKAGLKLKLF